MNWKATVGTLVGAICLSAASLPWVIPKALMPVPSLPSQFILERYDRAGGLFSEEHVGPGSPLYLRTNSLLQSSDGWHLSFASYKTGPAIIHADTLTVRIHENFVIIDTKFLGYSVSLKKDAVSLLPTNVNSTS